jgi:hypothetical protein
MPGYLIASTVETKPSGVSTKYYSHVARVMGKLVARSLPFIFPSMRPVSLATTTLPPLHFQLSTIHYSLFSKLHRLFILRHDHVPAELIANMLGHCGGGFGFAMGCEHELRSLSQAFQPT